MAVKGVRCPPQLPVPVTRRNRSAHRHAIKIIHLMQAAPRCLHQAASGSTVFAELIVHMRLTPGEASDQTNRVNGRRN